MTHRHESTLINCTSPEQDKSSDEQEDDLSLSSDDENSKQNGHSGVQRHSSFQTLRFRTQKHFVGRMIHNRQSIKPLIGKQAYTALKQFEKLLKSHISNQKQVKILIRSIVKTIGKLGVVAKQQNLTKNQLDLAQSAKKQFYIIALTVCSFVRTDYTYNQNYLIQLLKDCQQTLCRCVAETLSSKSVDRINYVFNALCDPKLLDSVFSLNVQTEQRKWLLELTETLDSMLSSKTS